MQITDLVRDSPLRDLGTVLSQCAHVVVPRDEQDSFEYDPKEEVDIVKEKDGDSDESGEDYVPEGGSRGLGKSDGEGVKFRKRWQVKFRRKGWVKFRKREQVEFKRKGRVQGWVRECGERVKE